MISVSDILKKKKQPVQFWLTVFGMSLGMMASLLSIVLISDIRLGTSAQQDIFNENTLVIQKRVSRMTSLGLNGTGFTDEEILMLGKADFITDVAPFKTAHYEVGISENPGDGLPGFYTEMFLQSVPDSFLDNFNNTVWQWRSESDIVPIILPKSFLTLVNYGIAPSKGIPQVSEDLIKSVRLRLHLTGPKHKGVVLGRVVGFSSKISSVLVPESFINFSNLKYGSKSDKQPDRLFIKTNPDAFGKVNELIEDMNLDVSESELSISRITTYLSQMISVFFVFAFIILILAILALLQYLQMVLFNMNEEVRLLVKLGYRPNTIVRSLQNQFLRILTLIAVSSLVLVIILKWTVIQHFLLSTGIKVGYLGIGFGILFVILLLVGCVLILKRVLLNTIIKIFKKT